MGKWEEQSMSELLEWFALVWVLLSAADKIDGIRGEGREGEGGKIDNYQILDRS